MGYVSADTKDSGIKSTFNRPFPSSKKSHFQNEAKCETFVVKMSFICIIIANHFHINGFALSLVLKVRFFGTRKWPIGRIPEYTGCPKSSFLYHFMHYNFLSKLYFYMKFLEDVYLSIKYMYSEFQKLACPFCCFITFCSRCGMKWNSACRPTNDPF